MKRSGRPKPMSDRRRSEQGERQRVVQDAYDRDNHDCRARLLVPHIRCGGRLDPHEVIPRSAWRAGYLVLSNVFTICRNHHRWIGDNPAVDGPAHKLGLHGFSWEVPPATME